MKDYQERVIIEKDELDTKTKALLVFIDSESFGRLGEQERKRMRTQEILMELYSNVLADRIAAF